jgi:quercetin dioxygenase-like cupin family protein
MLPRRLALACSLTAISAVVWSCRDSSTPTGPAVTSPTSSPQHSVHGAQVAPASASHSMQMHDAPVSLAATAALAPFTYRGAIDPYRINQLPDFMVRSKVRSDIVMQQSVFNPGNGPWHTHPGPSFIYVIQGQLKLQRVGHKGHCTETQVYAPGAVYTEVADQVHRAVVVSAEPAVVMVTRFNIPIGSPVTIPADDPGCTSFSAAKE